MKNNVKFPKTSSISEQNIPTNSSFQLKCVFQAFKHTYGPLGTNIGINFTVFNINLWSAFEIRILDPKLTHILGALVDGHSRHTVPLKNRHPGVCHTLRNIAALQDMTLASLVKKETHRNPVDRITPNLFQKDLYLRIGYWHQIRWSEKILLTQKQST